MEVQEWFDKYGGTAMDFDHAYGNQCVDVYDKYCFDVVKCPIIYVQGAKNIWDNYPVEYFDKIPNTPSGIPQKGDVVIWGMGTYGHVGIATGIGDTNSFTSLDQNWDGVPTNPSKVIKHDYKNVLGWLRPKNALPNGWDSTDYLQANPDVSQAGVDPIDHYKKWGFLENRPLHPAPVETPVVIPPIKEPIKEEEPIVEETKKGENVDTIKKNFSSKKLWVTLLTVALLMLNGDFNQAMVVVMTYLGIQGYVDSK
jgi:hypothetical protein